MRLISLRRRKPPRLAVLLLLSNMAVLTLPLSGLWALRLYDSTLVRQTESELVAQAAVVAAAFREELRRDQPGTAPAVAPAPYPPSAAALRLVQRPGLDLAVDPVLPPPPEPSSAGPAQPQALAVGAVLAPILRDAQSVTLAAFRVTDAHGVIIASTGGDLGRSLAGWQEVSSVLAGAPFATSMRRYDPANPSAAGSIQGKGLRIFVALPVEGSNGIAGVVVLSRTPRNILQVVWGKRWALSGLAAVLLVVAVCLALWLSRLVTRPMTRVVQQAQLLARGAEIDPLEHPGTQEVAELSTALNRMAVTLDQRARYITAFAASVSHEFKTPLATLRGAAELLNDEPEHPHPDERRKLIDLVSDSTTRLDKLVRRLLDLARADMTRPIAGGSQISSVMRSLVLRYQERGLIFETDLVDATVALPSDALEAMLSSLLDNAALHAGVGGRVRISVATSRGLVIIEVQDDGPGISASNVARIFEPFFTTSRAQGGTGLGLPIAQSIARGAGGNLELLPSRKGALFRASLPSAPACRQRHFTNLH